MLEILPGRFGGEAGARGAGVGVEPVSHFGLVFCGGVFVPEDVGNPVLFAVIGAGCGALAVLWWASGDWKGVPEKSVLVGDGVGVACDVCPD